MGLQHRPLLKEITHEPEQYFPDASRRQAVRRKTFSILARRSAPLIFESESRETSQGRIDGNGLAPAIVRLGRRVLIDESKFFDWVQSQQVQRCVDHQGAV
jgi:hypothetical protein